MADAVREVSARGMSVVLVEQNLGLAFSVARDVAVMQKGRIVHEAPCAEFRSNPAGRRRLLGVD